MSCQKRCQPCRVLGGRASIARVPLTNALTTPLLACQQNGQLCWQHLVFILAGMPNSPKVFAALEDEWTRLSWTHDEHVVRAWAEPEPMLTSFATPVDVVLGTRRRGEVERTNAIVGALLRLAAEEQVVRTLLQAVLPGLEGRVRHVGIRSGGRRPLPGWDNLEDLGTDTVAMAIERIKRLAGTSPAWPASAIVGGTWRRVRTAALAVQRDEQLALPLEEASALPSPRPDRSAAEELANELAAGVARGTLRPRDAKLIYATRVLGYSPAELVSVGGPDARALRTRRARAERALLAASA